MKFKKFVWPVIGSGAVIFSVWLLYKEFRGLSLQELADSLNAIPYSSWMLSIAATLAAYAALAAYDHVALLHLRRRVNWLFITLCSFTTYAVAHNIGASVFSGALIRYRAYSSKGLSPQEIGVLVAFCSLTFALGAILLTGIVLVARPDIAERFVDVFPHGLGASTGILLLAIVVFYLLGSWLELKPFRIRGFELHYPRLPVALRQLFVAPMELIAAGSILYFALPAEGNPGFVIVLGIFLISFSIALLSHAPGGVGVLELVFITGLPEMDPTAVLAALLVFRLLYLVIPFVISLVVILLFERSQYRLTDNR